MTLAWGQPRSGRSFDGPHESGKECPNCGWPVPQGQTIIEKTPASASWTCEHCGWTMVTARHEQAGGGAIVNNRTPRPGRP